MAFNAGRYALPFVAILNGVCLLQYARLLTLKSEALSIQHGNVRTTIKSPASRVTICDRNGNVIAKSRLATGLFIDPVVVRDNFTIKEAYSVLTDKYSVTPHDALEALKHYNSDKRYVLVSRDTGPDINRGSFPGFHLETSYQRDYADYELNRSWLGFSDPYLAGHEGIELYYHKLLAAGAAGIPAVVDGRRRLISAEAKIMEPIMLVTTVDLLLQKITAEVAAAYMERLRSDSISVLGIDPNNGEILCYYTESVGEGRRNPLAVDSYEPGSIMKTFLIAALIDRGVFDPKRVITCTGERLFRKRKVRCHHPHGTITAADVLMLSCNIGAIELAHDIGHKELRDFLTSNTAFAKKTGIDLPFESDGFLPSLANWNYYTQTSVPFGYEIRTTALQIAASYSVFCNGGNLVRPHFLKGVRYLTGGDVYTYEPSVKRLQVSGAALSSVKEMLHRVVVDGTAKQFRYKGIDYGGKTGTAHIYDRKARAYSNTYNSSFVAFAPYEKPVILLYVAVNKPKTAYFASATAVPVASEILKRLDVEMDYFRRRIYENSIKVDQ